MADKWSNLAPSGASSVAKETAGDARVKGTPFLKNNVPVFPFDDCAEAAEGLVVHRSPTVEIRASGASADLAAVEFVLYQPVYWDAANSKVTNVASGNQYIGRCLESKDLSGGVAAGDTLLIEFDATANPKMTCGLGTLDGSNPTPVTTGLSVVAAFVAGLIKNSAPGVGTSVLTVTISSNVPNVYAWKPTSSSDCTLVASTGTETFYWIAIGQ